jgi:hypothetical protein
MMFFRDTRSPGTAPVFNNNGLDDKAENQAGERKKLTTKGLAGLE